MRYRITQKDKHLYKIRYWDCKAGLWKEIEGEFKSFEDAWKLVKEAYRTGIRKEEDDDTAASPASVS